MRGGQRGVDSVADESTMNVHEVVVCFVPRTCKPAPGVCSVRLGHKTGRQMHFAIRFTIRAIL